MSHTTDMPDIMLIEALREGSVKAFNIIYKTYAKRLFVYVGRATQNREDTEEIVHDIFISLWNNRKNIDPHSSLSSLIFSMAYKRRIDFFRQKLRTPIIEDYLALQDQIVSADSDPLEYEDFMRMFNLALGKIPPQQRKYIILSRVQYLSNKEIATQLNVSEKTVRNELYTGMKLLRNEMRAIIRNNI